MTIEEDNVLLAIAPIVDTLKMQGLFVFYLYSVFFTIPVVLKPFACLRVFTSLHHLDPKSFKF